METKLLNKEDQKKVLKFCRSCLTWINNQDMSKSKKNEAMKKNFNISIVQLERIKNALETKKLLNKSAAELNLISFFYGLNHLGEDRYHIQKIVEKYKIKYYDFLYLSIKLKIDNDFNLYQYKDKDRVLPKTITKIITEQKRDMKVFCDTLYNLYHKHTANRVAEEFKITTMDLHFIIEHIERITKD